MLVLTRKIGESIRIDDSIKITIVESDGHHIKIGIDAPREVAVHREEVYQRILAENKKAVVNQESDMFAMADLFKKRD